MVTNTLTAMEVVDTGEKRDGRGRRITPPGRRDELVAAWRQSGMTLTAFARREGVNYTTFCSWVQQREREAGAAPGDKVRFAEVQVSAAASSEAVVEVRLADGTVVRGARAGEVVAVVRALRG
ncbi:hypothetical protein [Opitutus sp. ER46]|uniref:IS66 family insertion sequence element accessory protein TnpA n=1 Tax=Opitutus sp. ER46 TaxID=2161864 RepID=UPI000D30C2CA|nr:hypothetical protein [Opitutus sp. ER46]PTX94443.1 hypothetical protein DB354_11905 [Opitutus sp. ER46]